MKNIKIVKAKYVVSSPRRKGKAVMCLDTGEVYTSAKECAEVNNLDYARFTYQLRRNVTADNDKLYCFVCDMAYYANAIQKRIYMKAKAEYDQAKMTIEAYSKMFG